MDRVVGADQEVGADLRELVRGREHQLADALQVAPLEARDVVRERWCVHRDFGMPVRAEQLRTLRTDRAVTERRTFGRTGNDTDVLGHCGPAPLLDERDSIALPARINVAASGYIAPS
jgi:hypothetical protein